MSGSYRELWLGRGYSGAALESLTPKQPTSCVQAPVPETQDLFVTDRVIKNGERRTPTVGDPCVSESHHLKNWGCPTNSGSGGNPLRWGCHPSVGVWCGGWGLSPDLGKIPALGPQGSWDPQQAGFVDRLVEGELESNRPQGRDRPRKQAAHREALGWPWDTSWWVLPGQEEGPRVHDWGLFLATCPSAPSWALETRREMAKDSNHPACEPLVHFFNGSLWSWGFLGASFF